MREIKFRGWTGISMLENVSFESNTNGVNGVTFLQYTGLKDLTGKEIYEGDILGIYKRLDGVWSNKIVVEWRATRTYTGFGVATPYMDNHSGTILGNIYENPELLKEK